MPIPTITSEAELKEWKAVAQRAILRELRVTVVRFAVLYQLFELAAYFVGGLAGIGFEWLMWATYMCLMFWTFLAGCALLRVSFYKPDIPGHCAAAA